jgi:hypothetical protein
MIYDVSHMFYIDFGNFPQSPFYFGSNLFWQKNLVLVFLTFRELRDSKKDKVGEHGWKNLRRIQRDKSG